MMNTFVITRDHGGNRIRAPYGSLFQRQRALLDSHRGYDAGALIMAKALARTFGAPAVAATTSRLLIDLNRSFGHPQLLSAGHAALPPVSGRRSSSFTTGPTARMSNVSSGRGVSSGHRVTHISFAQLHPGAER
jgi:predicted N-formylglutamate amidohydrolase